MIRASNGSVMVLEKHSWHTLHPLTSIKPCSNATAFVADRALAFCSLFMATSSKVTLNVTKHTFAQIDPRHAHLINCNKCF